MPGRLVLWDVHVAYAIERWRRSSGPAVRRWLAAVGEIEALSSLAGYAYEHPDDVFPDLSAGTPASTAKGWATRSSPRPSWSATTCAWPASCACWS